MTPDDIFRHIATPGDIGGYLLGFAAGFAIDVFAFPTGVEPQTTALVWGAAVLGCKKSLASWWTTIKQKSVLKKRLKNLLRAYARVTPLTQIDDVGPAYYGTVTGERARNVAEIKTYEGLLERDAALWEAGLLPDSVFRELLIHHVEFLRPVVRQLFFVEGRRSLFRKERIAEQASTDAGAPRT
jgi:hypothetical protein